MILISLHFSTNRSSSVRKVMAALCLLIALGATAEPLRVVIPQSMTESPQDAGYYFKELLVLAFEKTEATDGPYVIEEYPKWLGAQRMRAMIAAQSGLDILWSTTNPEREEQLRPIKINLLKGLNEYRILLIRHADQPKFSGVASLDDLKKFTAGSGTHWQDTVIMRANGLPVETSWDIDSLFKMLSANRFDYISRGAHEIWDEVERNKKINLAVEKNLMLHYPSPTYFFVHHNNFKLADRLLRGLQMAQKDGSFDTLFMSIPAYKKGFEEINNTTRKVFELSRPDKTISDNLL